MFSILILGVIILILCHEYISRKYIQTYFKNVLCPTRFPLIGHIYLFLGKEPKNALRTTVSNIGFPCLITDGWRYFYFTKDPHEIKVILNHNDMLEKGSTYSLMEPILGNSLLIAKSDIWKHNRKAIIKNFKQTILNSFVEKFYEKSCLLMKSFKHYQNSEDLNEIIQRFTLDTFSETSLGVNLNVQLNSDNTLVDSFTKNSKDIIKRLINPLMHPNIVYFNLPVGKQFLKNVETLKKNIKEIIETRKLENRNKKDKKEEVSIITKISFLDWLLELQKEDSEHFTDLQIIDEVNLFIWGATDTSAYTLVFTITLLGMHPAIQEKVYNEVVEVIGKTEPITAEHLPKLKYTERVIKEALRIFPIAPILARFATKDVDIGTRIIPKHTTIGIFCLFLQRDEKYWPNHMKFDPDRFLRKPNEDLPTYLPFSAGPKNCLGYRYAFMVMKMVVANTVRTFKIEANYERVEDIPIETEAFLRTTKELRCSFKPRIDT